MKVAVPVHRDRISPLFDTARQVLLVEIQGGTELGRSCVELPGTGMSEQVRSLVAAGAEALVCGAISGRVLRELLRRQLRVWPGVAGETEEVISALVNPGFPDESLRMPGCRRRGGQTRHRWGWQWARRRAHGRSFGRGRRCDLDD